MKIFVAQHAGFCSGVRTAVGTAMHIPPENTYVLGELIHNPVVTERIAARGIGTAERVGDVPDGATLVIRSHGAARAVFEECKRRNIKVIDCTCPFVKRTQQIVAERSRAGETVVIAGKAGHPEVEGLLGWAEGRAVVAAGEEELVGRFSGEKVALVAQTTFSKEKFSKIAEILRKECQKTVEIFETICYTTIRRQLEAKEISQKCDAVLILGGKNSSNTGKLYEIASANCGHVFWSESADGFEYEKFLFYERVGVIAGASTPDWQTQEVLCKMEENNAEVRATTMQDVVEGIDKEERYKKGQVITARIVSATDEGIYVSASGKLEIMVSKDELACAEYTREGYADRIGEEIQLVVVEVNPKVKLSEKLLAKQREEEELLKDIEAGKEFSVTCTGFNKGGLTAELGTYPVFVPAKEIRTGYVKDLDKYTGKKLRLRLIELRRGSRKEIIASQRVILEEERAAREAARAEKEEAFFESIHEDDVVEGKVERVTNFGAFVSVDGFDCLAHISDLSWTGVKSVTDVLEIGKRYPFKVLKVDRVNKKVSIGYKQLQPQPWDLAAEKYAEGDIVHGKVVRIVPFGAFVELEKGVDGLVHVSQITYDWLDNPTAALKIGEEVDAKILAFNPAERKITLSIKALQPRPETENRPERRDRNRNADGEDRPRTRKAGGRHNAGSEDEEEYREWTEGNASFSISIADQLGSDEEK